MTKAPIHQAIEKITTMIEAATTAEEADRLTGRLLELLEKQGKEEPRLWSLEQASAYLQLAPHTIRQHVSQERIPFLKLNGAARFDPVALKKWACQDRAVKPASCWRR